MTAKHRQALGKGLAALLGPPVHGASPSAVQDVSQQRSLLDIPIETVRPNRNQPRQDFDLESLRELAESIKQAGLVQPLVVRSSEGAYELVAGERRLRAAKLAGLKSVPCVLTAASDEQSLLLALVENLQREDLNPMDEAEAYARLREEFDLTQEAVAERVGKSRVAVANSLRLLQLPREIQEDVRDSALSAGHARALLSVSDAARQRELWQTIKTRGLSVREAEEKSRTLAPGRPRQTSAFTGRPRGGRDPQAERLMEDLTSRVGCRVTIRRRGEHRGQVEIHFSSLEEFERILEVLGLPAAERL
jgi:ParB family chromosome partitioning protein